MVTQLQFLVKKKELRSAESLVTHGNVLLRVPKIGERVPCNMATNSQTLMSLRLASITYRNETRAWNSIAGLLGNYAQGSQDEPNRVDAQDQITAEWERKQKSAREDNYRIWQWFQ